MEWINFRHLYSFWMVCKHSGFNAAASKMHVAQSAISGQVAELEDYLGEKLLHRTTRSLQITDVGKEVLNYADVIFNESRQINYHIKNKMQLQRLSIIKIGVVGGVSRNFLFRLMVDNYARDPDLRIHVISGSYHELNDRLINHQLDVLITLELPRKQDLSEVSYQRVGHSPLCLAAKKKVLNQIRNKKNKHPIRCYAFSFPYENDLINDILIPKTGIEFSLSLETDDIPLLRFFANEGEGAVIIPEIGIHEDLESNRLTTMKFAAFPEINIYGIYLKKGFQRDLLDKFMEAT